MDYKTPGVYVEEISLLPPSVAQVETAIPAFIGYTETAKDVNLQDIASLDFPYTARIRSFAEYKERFGGAADVYSGTSTVTNGVVTLVTSAANLKFKLYYALQVYFANGGGPCYITSCAKYGTADFTSEAQMNAGLSAVGKEDEPTIIVFPDATGFALAQIDNFYTLYKNALNQCSTLGDRVVLVDVYSSTGAESFDSLKTNFRSKIGINSLKYGVANYPYIKSTFVYDFDESALDVNVDAGGAKKLRFETSPPGGAVSPAEAATSLFHSDNESYQLVKKELAKQYVVMSPSAGVAGLYAFVDRTRGVWKAPANVSMNAVKALMSDIDDADQQDMNITSSGKSVNAIREFHGKGTLLWGARTLDGNDNEWRYVSVRRFFNMVEESVKKSTIPFVFEPNDANTWVKVRAMIENFLLLQWRAGALAGAAPEDAFFVRVGLGQTMTSLDILEGRMNIEIGMAAVRPAEFIILKFSHKMQES